MRHALDQHRIATRMVFILLALCATIVHAAIPTGERTVLLNLYTSTNGATWTTSTNWNGAAGTECTWYGVSCDVAGTTVTRIDLQSNNLTGSLPGDLNGLTNLNQFFANDNQLTGSIPALTGLANLGDFIVFNNQLTGSIPALTGLTNLITFYVYNNQLTGSVPEVIGLANLGYFAVHRNQLTGSIPALTGLTKLTYFYVYRNLLTGPMSALTGLTNLSYFAVHFNQLTGSIPALTGLTNLHYFQINNNQLTGSIPALTGLTNLSQFIVNDNQLAGNVPSVPSPSALLAASSSLCPNFLNHTPDPAWDAATGVTPWYTSCTGTSPPVLLGAVSRKVHGAAGTFDLPLSLTPVTNPTTEPRQSSTATVVMTFDVPIIGAIVAVTEGIATASAPTFSGNDVIVPLSGVTNQQYITISLTNVASAVAVGGSGSVRVGFLLGDVNGSRVVSLADLGQVNAQLSQPVTAANFLKDVNVSGTLTLADKGIANANLTKALPAP